MTVTGQADAWQASIASDVAVLKQGYTGLHADVANLGSKIDALASQVATSQKTNWPLILAAAALTGTIIGGGWTVMDLQNRLTVSESVSPLKAALSANDTEQRSISERVDRLSTSIVDNRTGLAGVSQKISEMEVQDCSISDNARMALGSLRQLLAVLWSDVRKEPLPPIEMMPRVGRCN